MVRLINIRVGATLQDYTRFDCYVTV